MASGATDLITEAATSKISGEEERYSNTDLPVFKANMDGAMEVVSLLTPDLKTKDASLLTQIDQRDAAVTKLLSQYQATPGYDDTGYVEYSTGARTAAASAVDRGECAGRRAVEDFWAGGAA